jgi:hypothetical protein
MRSSHESGGKRQIEILTTGIQIPVICAMCDQNGGWFF